VPKTLLEQGNQPKARKYTTTWPGWAVELVTSKWQVPRLQTQKRSMYAEGTTTDLQPTTQKIWNKQKNTNSRKPKQKTNLDSLWGGFSAKTLWDVFLFSNFCWGFSTVPLGIWQLRLFIYSNHENFRSIRAHFPMTCPDSIGLVQGKCSRFGSNMLHPGTPGGRKVLSLTLLSSHYSVVFNEITDRKKQIMWRSVSQLGLCDGVTINGVSHDVKEHTSYCLYWRIHGWKVVARYYYLPY